MPTTILPLANIFPLGYFATLLLAGWLILVLFPTELALVPPVGGTLVVVFSSLVS
jgi:hypothetical protein